MKKIIQFFKKIIQFFKNEQYKNPPPKPIELPHYTITIFDKEIVQLINKYRQENTLSKLTINEMLCSVAASHSIYMAENEKASHDYATDRQNIFLPKLLAEIVGYGYKMPQSYFAAWTGSHSHNKKMLDPDHTEIGIAAYPSVTGVKYVTVLFLS